MLNFKVGDSILFIKGEWKGRIEQIIKIGNENVEFVLLKNGIGNSNYKNNNVISHDPISFYIDNKDIVIYNNVAKILYEGKVK